MKAPLLVSALALLLAPHLAAAAPAGAFELESESLTVSPGARTAKATGGVVARGNGLRIECEEADATYAPEGAGHRTIDTLVVRGQVKVHRDSDGLDATAGAAEWNRKAGTLVLTGDPVVRRGPDVLTGEQMSFGLADDTLEVTDARATLPRSERGEPLDARAEKLFVREAGRKLVLEGRVRLAQGEFTARADRGTAVFSGRPEDAKKADKISRVTLAGHVDATRGRQHATAGRAEYDAASGELVLEGSPVIEQDGERLSGARIVVDGAKGTARATNAVARVKGRP